MWLDGCVPPTEADINLFRGGKADSDKKLWDKDALYFQIPEGKRVIADDGLVGEPDKITIASPLHTPELKEYIKLAKACQESLHTRLKSFNILGHRFRHGKNTDEKMALHKMAVQAVCVVIQFDYKNGNPPFDMPY